MAAYLLGIVTVTDPPWIEEYGPAVGAQVEAAGGKYIARDMEVEHVEGSAGQPSVIVMVEFPDKAALRSWYDSSEYAPYIQKRQAGSTGDLFIVDGL